MKALSLTQPWATLVAIGAKTIETRSWPTRYRGPFAIHASKAFPGSAKELVLTEPFFSVLERNAVPGEPFMRQFPLGAVVAVVQLVGCERVNPLGRWQGPDENDEPERSFGDFSAGRWMFFLEDVRPLAHPILPVKGALGFWDMPPDVLAAVQRELRTT